MSKERILRRMANTIVANLGNTEPFGLFDGKMGVCLFLYHYARHADEEAYAEIASELLDDVFRQLKPDLSPSVMDGVASVGWGLAACLKEGFIETDADDSLFRYIDDALFRDSKAPLTKEIRYPVPLFSAGVYLLSRMAWRMDTVESGWVTQLVANARSLVSGYLRSGRSPRLSLPHSMLHVFSAFYKALPFGKRELARLLGDLVTLCARSVEERNYEPVDLLLLRRTAERLPGCVKAAGGIPQPGMDEPGSPADALGTWYENGWWEILYGTPVADRLPLEAVIRYLDGKVDDAYYDLSTLNSKLSAAGIRLMRKTLLNI